MISYVRVDQAKQLVVTGVVQPVLTFDGWEVETVHLDRGTGMREWIEVRNAGEVTYCASAGELQRLLSRHGLDLATFIEVDTIDDGCE